MDDSSAIPKLSIVIPVHNALSQTVRCLESIFRHSSVAVSVTLVNDKSDLFTTESLRSLAKHDPRLVLLENEENLGFLHSVNRGLDLVLNEERNLPPFVIIINSDTVVSAGWLEAFERCFKSDPTIGLATPLSNNAVNLSLRIPEGLSSESFAAIIQADGKTNDYPDITTAVGFCLGIRTEVLKKLGGFDNIFAPGYAEDSDYHFRVLAEGFRSVLVADCFVYHESHASFSERSQDLMRQNRPRFDERWARPYRNELERHDEFRSVARISERLNVPAVAKRRHDLLFVLPNTSLGGGAIVIFEIANRLILRGIDAAIAFTDSETAINFPLLCAPYFLPSHKWLEKGIVPSAQTYVATHYETCPYAISAHLQDDRSHIAYLIQGYEPWFPSASVDYVQQSYAAIENRIVVSGWLERMLKKAGFDSTIIPDGVDTNQFYPTRPPDERADNQEAVLMTMLRYDPQGGFRLGFNVIKRLKKQFPTLRIVAVGDLVSDPEISAYLDLAFGSVDRRQLAELYQKADIFFDSSMVQGFGLMGLEAMSSGVAVVLTRSGGVEEYADESCAILCPRGDEEGIVQGIESLLSDSELLRRMKHEGRRRALEFDWQKIANRFEVYFKELARSAFSRSSENLIRMSQFLTQGVIRARTLRMELKRTLDLMEQELKRSSPRSMREVFSENNQPMLYEKLSGTIEGSTVLAVYENSRIALAREADYLQGALGGSTLFARVREVVPPDLL